jgi:hypothetical protein
MNRTPVPKEFEPQPDGITEPQLKYIEGLIDQRNLLASPKHFDAVNAMDAEEYAAYIAHLKAQAAQLSKQTASAWITALRALPIKPLSEQQSNPLVRAGNGERAPRVDVMAGRTGVVYEEMLTDDGKPRRIGRIQLPDGSKVLAGSYGVDTSDDDRFSNDFSFFKVWVNEDYGRGWGVKLYVSDYTHRVKLAFPTQLDALKKIAPDPDAAARAFGLEFGRCGVCGRGLTNDESRELGIGPVCRQRV